MDTTRLSECIANADSDTRMLALELLLKPHAMPVFGAVKVAEHEVAAFKALQRLGFINQHPDEYDLVMTLRVTKANARSLLYQVSLRNQQNEADINNALRKLLSQPLVTLEVDKVLIEVSDPLLMDILRQRVRKLGYISDGSFAGTITKLPLLALSAVIADLIPIKDRAVIQKKLSAQGVKGNDLSGLVSSAIGQLGKRLAGKVGERVAEKVGDQLSDLLVDGTSAAFEWAKQLNKSSDNGI